MKKTIAALLCLLLAILPTAGLAEEAAEAPTAETTEETVQAEAPEELREERQAAALPEVLSAKAEKTIVQAGQPVQFTVKTPAYAKFLALFSENGTKCKVWSKTGNSTDDGETRTWTVSYAFKNKGEREITFRTSTTKTYGPDSEKVRVSVKKYVDPMTIEVQRLDQRINTGVHVFNIWTSGNVEYIHMFSENGAKMIPDVIKRSEVYPTGRRQWFVSYDIKSPGFRKLTFKASIDGKTYGAEDTYEVTVEPKVYSSTVNAREVHVGDVVTFTVVTHKTAKYLSASVSNHVDFQKWDAETYSSVVNGKRLWTVDCTMKYEAKKVLLCAGLTREYIYLDPIKDNYNVQYVIMKILPAVE